MDSNLERLRYIAVFDTIDYIAKSLREDTEALFPNGITAKDYEQTFIYSAALFSFWDSDNKNLLSDSFANALSIFLDTLEVDYNYSEAQISEVTHTMIDDTKKYVHALFDLLQAEDYETALMDYVKIVLSNFPSVESSSPFSLAGISFVKHFDIYYDFLGKVYEVLISDDTEEIKALLYEYTLENYQNIKDDTVNETLTESSPNSSKYNNDITQQQTGNEQKGEVIEKKKGIKKFFPFLCLLCLICSLIGNITLYNSNTKLIKENTRALSDVKYWKHWHDVEDEHAEKLAAENYKMRDEYNFYHNNAVIVTEYGYRYHRYGCSHTYDCAYWIYNIENAEYQGYTPCKDCWD